MRFDANPDNREPWRHGPNSEARDVAKLVLKGRWAAVIAVRSSTWLAEIQRSFLGLRPSFLALRPADRPRYALCLFSSASAELVSVELRLLVFSSIRVTVSQLPITLYIGANRILEIFLNIHHFDPFWGIDLACTVRAISRKVNYQNNGSDTPVLSFSSLLV